MASGFHSNGVLCWVRAYGDTRDMATMRDTDSTVWCPACEDESEWCAVTLAASHPSGYCHLHAFLLGKDEGR